MPTLLHIEDLWKTFPQKAQPPVVALSSISLEIEGGAFAALSGPSGSGKTTLLTLIGGLDRPAQGKVYLEGEEITGLSQKQLTYFRLRQIGFIFQDYNLIHSFTAAENIEYVLWLQGVQAGKRRKKAVEAAERLGIASLLHRRPWQLSRGQQQRVAVARAIVHRPRLVLGDEITANLDQEAGIELMKFLKELNQEEGITFLYATHDPTMLAFAERVVKLRDGKIPENASA